ncbi:cholecystokinin-like [Rhincodon typus]|uniref:cholecystokinin-like n=1 Tax=Rhincodon typus TaxID=259920 RepID=UPI002030DF89|nr:cholecystokinin-like [Rhincodon typus]
MTNTVYISVLVVILATGSLSKPLSDPHNNGGIILERTGKYLSGNGAVSLDRRAAALKADDLISKLLPQIQEAGLLNQADRYQLRDVLHQMHDRDYAGWMDFGKRSIEEYEMDS